MLTILLSSPDNTLPRELASLINGTNLISSFQVEHHISLILNRDTIDLEQN